MKDAIEPQKKSQFLNSFHYFRAIAILLVVLGHSDQLSRWAPDTRFDFFVCNLIANATVFFVFIGGFLFERIYIRRGQFDFKKFIFKRLSFVVLPYTICTVFFATFNGIFASNIWLDFISTKNLTATTLIGFISQDLFRQLLQGSAMTGYWFIPMVILIYTVSPILVRIAKSHYLLIFCIAGLCISLIIHRPPRGSNTIDIVQSFLYFMPIYMLGVWTSKYYDRLLKYLGNFKLELLALLLAIALNVGQILLTSEVGNFHKPLLMWNGLDINLLQKLCLTYFLLSVLSRLEAVKLPFLSYIAEISFPIYFLHMFTVSLSKTYFLNGKYMNIFKKIHAIDTLWGVLISAILMLIPCLVIASLLKRVLKQDSRYIIGW